VNDNPIGIFDSGIGGFTVLREIQKVLPNENLLYVADSRHAPYGTKSSVFIKHRAFSISEFLRQNQVKAIVVACNTATASAIADLRKSFAVPFVGMEPAIKPAAFLSKKKIIGIMATDGTLKSDKYHKLSSKFDNKTRVISTPCPGLVEQIENGNLDGIKTKELLQQFILPLKDLGIDQLVLGCTHYPLLLDSIRQIAGKKINIIETGTAVARQLVWLLNAKGLNSTYTTKSNIKLWVNTDELQHVENIINKLFAMNLKAQKLNV